MILNAQKVKSVIVKKHFFADRPIFMHKIGVKSSFRINLIKVGGLKKKKTFAKVM